MKVYVLKVEENCGESEIQGVYLHEAQANKERARLVGEWNDLGYSVYQLEGDEDEDGEFEAGPDWGVDIRVEEMDVDETKPGPTCPHGVCSQNYIDTGEEACVVDTVQA